MVFSRLDFSNVSNELVFVVGDDGVQPFEVRNGDAIEFGWYANGLEDARSVARRVRFDMPVR
jgi:hypothetical protein